MTLGEPGCILQDMSIFKKVRLRPNQLRTVADRRFDDAETLRRTGRNARANGAMYLGGFVIECLLKARLMERHPWLQSQGSAEGLLGQWRSLWSLCYRSHDLDEIFGCLPDLKERLGASGSPRLLRSLKAICAEWTVYARYSPHNATIEDARKFLDQIKVLRPWLK